MDSTMVAQNGVGDFTVRLFRREGNPVFKQSFKQSDSYQNLVSLTQGRLTIKFRPKLYERPAPGVVQLKLGSIFGKPGDKWRKRIKTDHSENNRPY